MLVAGHLYVMQQCDSLLIASVHPEVCERFCAAPFAKVLRCSASGAIEVASAGTSKAVEVEGRRGRLLESSRGSKAGESQAAGASAAVNSVNRSGASHWAVWPRPVAAGWLQRSRASIIRQAILRRPMHNKAIDADAELASF